MNISTTEKLIHIDIAQVACQCLDGLVSVTAFCDFCRAHGWLVSDFNIVTEKITLCHDTGKTDADLMPIILWRELDISMIAR